MLRKGADRERVLTLLRSGDGLSPSNVTRVAAETGVPEAEVFGAGSFYSLIRQSGRPTRVCQGLSCRLAGSDGLLAQARASGIDARPTSCAGQCDHGPVWLDAALEPFTGFGLAGAAAPSDPELPIDLHGATAADASYTALARARTMGPEAVLHEIEASGLQGRGGAGFPAHRKWRSSCAQPERERYLVCNADEGEPGTFKDRQVMKRRPHRLLEGLAICAEVIGAEVIYIYTRGEVPAVRASLDAALAEVAETGAFAGRDVRLVSGYGAYICGEETALIESLEGRRGMPRLKPPMPTEVGFRGKPTLVHNVETLACVPAIVERGGSWFRSLGRTEAGTKLFCLSGHVRRAGVYELPLGVSLDELVDAAGGYAGQPIAFSPGGAASGFLPISESGRALDFASLAEVGSMLGSAGVVVLDDGVDMAEAASWQLAFFAEESCGQCAPCRIGTEYLRRQVERYLREGDPALLAAVDAVAWEMEEGSICGLGMTAHRPLTTARRLFPEAFARRAPAGQGEP